MLGRTQVPQKNQFVQKNQEVLFPYIFSTTGKCQNCIKKKRCTTILEQSVIIENFFKGIPLNLRKLVKIQAKKPLQSSFRQIYNLNENLNSKLSQETPQIQVISSILKNGIHNDSQCCVSLLNSFSSSQQIYSDQNVQSQRDQTLHNSQFEINESSQNISFSPLTMRHDFAEFEEKSSEISQQIKNAQFKTNKNEKNMKSKLIKTRNLKEKKLLRNSKIEWGLNKRIKQNEDNSSDCSKDQLKNVGLKLGRVLIHQDGQVFEQLNSEESHSSVEWQTNQFVNEIQQTQQSLISFLKKPPKINSLTQHLSILNKCILINSSTSVGKEVDKFLSTFYQFKNLTPSGGEIQSYSQQQNNKPSFNPSSNALSFPKQQQYFDDIQSSKQSYGTLSLINNKLNSQLSIEAHSEYSNILTNQQNSFQSIHSTCQKLFSFKIKDSSLLNQYNFSQIKKKQNPQYEIQQQKQIDQDQKQQDRIDVQEIQISNQIRQENQVKDCFSNSPTVNKKYGKFHNYNKLFMYNILNMFQASNLYNFGIPENIQREMQSIISKLKVNAKKNSRIQGKYPFDYFSHAHYNVLFLQLAPQNIQTLQTSEDILNLYQQCFQVNLKLELTSQQLTYINLLKAYFYQIFIECINFEVSILSPSGEEIISHPTNPRLEYTIKVIKGIQKLVQGVIIKRF